MWDALDEELLPIPDGLLCPVCQAFFDDPVATVDGHSYCRACIIEWFARHDRRAVERRQAGQHLNARGDEVPFPLLSPMTQLPLPSRALQQNVALRRSVAAYKEERPCWEQRERERLALRERLEELEQRNEFVLDEDHKTALVKELHHLRSRVKDLERQLCFANSELVRLRPQGNSRDLPEVSHCSQRVLELEAEYERQLRRAGCEITRLRAKVGQKEDKVSQLSERVLELECNSENQSPCASFSQAELQQVGTSEIDVEKLLMRIRSLEVSLEQQECQASETIKQLQAQITSTEEKLADRTTEAHQVEEFYSKQIRTLDSERSQLHTLAQEKHHEVAQLGERFWEFEAMMEKDTRKLTEQIAFLNEGSVQKEHAIATLSRRLSGIICSADDGGKDGHIDPMRLRAELGQRDNEVTILSQHIRDLQEGSKRQIMDANSEVLHLRAELKRKEVEVMRGMHRISELEAVIERQSQDASTGILNIRKELQQKTNDVMQLSAQVLELEEAVRQQQSNEQAEVDVFRREADQHADEVAKWFQATRATQEELETERENFTSEMQELDAERESFTSQMLEISNALAQCDRERNQLLIHEETQEVHWTHEIHLASTEIARLNQENDGRGEEAAQLARHTQELERESEVGQQTHAEHVAEFRAEASCMKDRVSWLSKQLEEAHEKLEQQLLEAGERFEKKMQGAVVERDELWAELRQKDTECLQREHVVSELRAELMQCPSRSSVVTPPRMTARDTSGKAEIEQALSSEHKPVEKIMTSRAIMTGRSSTDRSRSSCVGISGRGVSQPSGRESARVLRHSTVLTAPPRQTHEAGMASPLHIASCNGQLEMVRLLCQAGHDKDQADGTGATPLHVASCRGHLEVVRLLCWAGADKDRADDSGATPLHIAAIRGHLDLVKLLCEMGADKDKTDKSGVTPLHVASHMGHLSVVCCLLEAGAPPGRAANTGMTPLAAALRKGHSDVAAVLRQAEAWPRRLPRAPVSTELIPPDRQVWV